MCVCPCYDCVCDYVYDYVYVVRADLCIERELGSEYISWHFTFIGSYFQLALLFSVSAQTPYLSSASIYLFLFSSLFPNFFFGFSSPLYINMSSPVYVSYPTFKMSLNRIRKLSCEIKKQIYKTIQTNAITTKHVTNWKNWSVHRLHRLAVIPTIGTEI